jgi:hypothetical protein
MDITTDEIGNWNRLERLCQTMHSYWTKLTLERSALDATRHHGYWMLQAPGILDATGTMEHVSGPHDSCPVAATQSWSVTLGRLLELGDGRDHACRPHTDQAPARSGTRHEHARVIIGLVAAQASIVIGPIPSCSVLL